MSLKSKRLGSLVDIFQAETLEGSIKKIKLAKISPSENQPRKDRMKGVEELASSLRTEGLLQPIIVTKSENLDQYKIIAGERRYHAARLLGWQEIECKILNKDEKETFKIATIENLQRENLSPYEEIEAFSFLKQQYGYSDGELADIFGKSRNYMNEILSVQVMPPEEILMCKEVGIDTKNLLVQAAQSYKKGNFPEFLDNFKQGSLKTVKDAKKFNQSFNFKKEISDTEKSDLFKITLEENRIIIQSENGTQLKELIPKIQTLIKNYKNPS
ncbi:MAG TPA: ParB/RepB/Spo0J family partition protein [Leptospiraceae bacterium]|nr:ParB/RepB/Spo0J family partition protein [Leptospiraceae bacterium]HMY65266.1 ParB/RepB/Spo0J family partition protein [Leptospiraceae bacterium]HMZ57393.1 ParB/RepB/Spo0J family partition protein [Leptospiraceae bacterium]HNF12049.1 ParB/RepB/Spo0J family partition protein [Leptospiraceae bacterium]HNI95944.1 ParB/RepB/Spo0J family partition protein [Leptospiraceae bacterium]